jgi:hypothetical protein
MPTVARERGTPLHLHDRFLSGVMLSFIEDLQALGDKDIGGDCARVASVLSRILDEYSALPKATILYNELVPQMKLITEYYKNWNTPPSNGKDSNIEYRKNYLDFIKTRRRYIVRNIIRRHVSVIVTELDLSFSSKLFAIMKGLPVNNEHFARTFAQLEVADKEYLPGAVRLQARPPKRTPTLDPVTEYLLSVRQLTRTKYFSTGQRGLQLREWARRHLSSLNEQTLLRFRTAFLRQAITGEARINVEQIIRLSDRALADIK